MKVPRGYPAGATLLLSSIMLLVEQAGGEAPWAYVSGFLLLLWYGFATFATHRAAVLSSFYQLFYWIGLLASAAIISTGVHILEIDQYGTMNGTFWVVVLFLVSGLEATILGFRAAGYVKLGRVRRLPDATSRVLVWLIAAGVATISVYVVVFHGGPILTGIDRTTFWSSDVPAWLRSVPSLVTTLFIFAAFYYFRERQLGRPIKGPLVVIGVFLFSGVFVLGEKFSLFVIWANVWLLLLASTNNALKIGTRHLVAAATAIVAVFGVVAYRYVSDGYGIEFILTRAALQSQLLWAVLEHGDAGAADWRCFFDCQGYSGRDLISERYLPRWRFEHYENVGSALSGFVPALSLLTVGIVAAAMLHLTLSFALGWLQRKVVTAMQEGNLIYTVLMARLHFAVVIFAFTTTPLTLGFYATAGALALYHLAFPATKSASSQMRS